MDKEEIKRAVGYQAALLAQPGMKVGLGTGSTAFYFIEKLIARCKEGLTIQAIASSERSLAQAKQGGIPLLNMESVSYLDLTIDGADQIDHNKRMIKGAGGALVREKILAAMSRRMVVIVDESKVVSTLGGCLLPVEVIPFGIQATLTHMEARGLKGRLRRQSDHSLYVTDNGNYIVDIPFERGGSTPEETNALLVSIPGVVETGFFFNLASQVIIGFNDGQVVIQS